MFLSAIYARSLPQIRHLLSEHSAVREILLSRANQLLLVAAAYTQTQASFPSPHCSLPGCLGPVRLAIMCITAFHRYVINKQFVSCCLWGHARVSVCLACFLSQPSEELADNRFLLRLRPPDSPPLLGVMSH